MRIMERPRGTAPPVKGGRQALAVEAVTEEVLKEEALVASG